MGVIVDIVTFQLLVQPLYNAKKYILLNAKGI